MIPIGMCSVVVLTWTIERLISLRKARVYSPELLSEMFELVPSRSRATKEHVKEATAHCESQETIVARVVQAGVEKLHRDESHAQTFLEEAATKEVHLLNRRLRPFEVCVAVAPLLGLLGTVLGMISCFEKASLADTASRADTLASGIYVALVTTAAGLCVAIPALLIHHYFLGRVDKVQDAVEEAASEFLDHYYGTATMVRVRKTASVQRDEGPAVPPKGKPEKAEAAPDSAEPVGTGS
jgi:biopolymer transport protein ExbB